MMAEAGIFIPLRDIKRDPALQGALSAYLAEQLGISLNSDSRSPDEGGLAELSVTEAKLFLNNCSDKTIKVLRFILTKGGAFTASELYRHLKVNDLRGVWTGLTRRLRGVTKNPDALLLNWFYRPTEDDWRAVMATRTVASFRIALAERA